MSRGATIRLPEQPVFERLLTEQEVIEALALQDRPNPSGSIRWLVRTKRLPCVRIARGIIRFRPSDVRAMIDDCHDS